jgi:Ca2+-binding EF-hand superfamily protein
VSAERLYAQFNNQNHKFVDYDEFITGLAIICRGSIEEKVHFLFEMYDVSHSKKILKSEISTLINQCELFKQLLSIPV